MHLSSLLSILCKWVSRPIRRDQAIRRLDTIRGDQAMRAQRSDATKQLRSFLNSTLTALTTTSVDKHDQGRAPQALLAKRAQRSDATKQLPSVINSTLTALNSTRFKSLRALHPLICQGTFRLTDHRHTNPSRSHKCIHATHFVVAISAFQFYLRETSETSADLSLVLLNDTGVSLQRVRYNSILHILIYFNFYFFSCFSFS